jgi:hypothetical protein
MAYGKEADNAREPIAESELERMAREFIRSSLGGPDSEIASIRERNVRAYNGTPDGDFAPPDIDDRSTYVSTDVADTVDGMIPQLLDVFVSDDKAVECEAKKPGQQAEQQARQATGYLNHLFYVRNDGLNVLHDWFQDAALQKMGHVKVWAEEEKEDSSVTYEGQTEDQLAAILHDGAELASEPMVDELGMLTFTVKQETTKMAFKVACVPQHEMRVDPNAKWGDEPAAIGEVRPKRKFELEEKGYDLSGIGSGGSEFNANGERDALLGDARGEADHELHESHKLYEYAELYFQIDADGDGVAEWVQLCLINGELVANEKVDGHPYADICLMPRAHAYHGDCPADRAYGIQKEQTNLARALFDNVYFTVNQRTYVNTNANVNISDLLDNRPGGIVRGQGAPGDAFGSIPQPGIPAAAWQMQEWLKVNLENRTGFTRYSQGMDADSLNKTATGINIITSKADIRLRLMTRFAAQGIRKMFTKLLKLATQHQDAEDWFNVNGEWQAVNPFEWRDQFSIKINVGLGHGTREQKMQAVMAMLPLQQMGVQMGVVRPEHIANTIRLAATVNEFKNPDEFCDAEPTGALPPDQAKQMQGQMQQMGQENAQLKQQVASKDGELQLKAAELDLKHQELQQKGRESQANFMLQAQSAQRADRDSEIKGAESAQRMQQSGDEDARIDSLEQQVAMLSAALSQLFTQQPSADDGMGMDAPAAPPL